MVKDLVCGMGVEEDSPETCSTKYLEITYFFCSVDCLLLFIGAPREYVNPQSEQESTAKDVVCGMGVDTHNAPFMTGYNGTVYYFCSEACRQEFLFHPKQFVEK